MATAYGWTKKEILEQLYPDEIEFYLKRIGKYQATRDLTQLAIIHNPHTKDPKKLALDLESRVKKFEGGEYWAIEEMDEENARKLEQVRKEMQKNAAKRRRQLMTR